jgi:putative transposase
MPCPYCKSKETKERKLKTELGYRTFYCQSCERKYNERSGSPFNFLEYPTEIVFLVVFWRLRYKLSLRDLSEIFIERGFEFTHQTVLNWEKQFAPLITAKLKQKRKGKAVKKIHVDETYIKIKKEQFYLYRAIDKFGNLVDVRLSKTRDLAAAETFFKKMVETVGHKPKQVTTDKHDSYPKAIRKILGKKVKHRTSKYKNNVIEQDHRAIKQRYYPMRGFKNFDNAANFCEAFDEVREHFRWRTYKNEKLPIRRQRTLFKMKFADTKREFLAA